MIRTVAPILYGRPPSAQYTQCNTYPLWLVNSRGMNRPRYYCQIITNHIPTNPHTDTLSIPGPIPSSRDYLTHTLLCLSRLLPSWENDRGNLSAKISPLCQIPTLSWSSFLYTHPQISQCLSLSLALPQDANGRAWNNMQIPVRRLIRHWFSIVFNKSPCQSLIFKWWSFTYRTDRDKAHGAFNSVYIIV